MRWMIANLARQSFNDRHIKKKKNTAIRLSRQTHAYMSSLTKKNPCELPSSLSPPSLLSSLRKKHNLLSSFASLSVSISSPPPPPSPPPPFFAWLPYDVISVSFAFFLLLRFPHTVFIHVVACPMTHTHKHISLPPPALPPTTLFFTHEHTHTHTHTQWGLGRLRVEASLK